MFGVHWDKGTILQKNYREMTMANFAAFQFTKVSIHGFPIKKGLNLSASCCLLCHYSFLYISISDLFMNTPGGSDSYTNRLIKKNFW